jgi:MFS family permease
VEEPTYSEPARTAEKASGAAWYALAVLTATYMLGNADRQVLAMMIVPVQRDLHLTDVEFSLVQGLAFALFFSTGGLVAGWAIDRFSRRMVTMASLAGWSAFTGLSAAATGFWSLFAARCGVGMGESTMLPGGYSLIADLFPKRLLGMALGIYTMGANVGLALSFILGSGIAAAMSSTSGVSLPLIGTVHAWQVTFLLLGAVGLLFAPLFLTFRDPPRREQLSSGVGLFKPALIFLGARARLFSSHFLAFGISNAVGLVVLTWSPAILQRRFGWDQGRAGLALGLVVGSAGTIGPLVVGLIARRLDRAGKRYFHFAAPMIFAAAIIGFASLSIAAASAWVWLAALFGIYFMTAATLIYGSAALQLVTPNELRGRMVALYVAAGGIIGAALGPLLVALITEHVLHDQKAVGTSMGIVVIAFGAIMLAALQWGLPRYRVARDDMIERFGS